MLWQRCGFYPLGELLIRNFKSSIFGSSSDVSSGTIPALWKEAEEGRSTREILHSTYSFIGGCVLAKQRWHAIGGSVEANFFTWMIAQRFNRSRNYRSWTFLYQTSSYTWVCINKCRMVSNVNMSVILPIALGGLVTLALYKTCTLHFSKAYPQLFHFIRNRAFNCNDYQQSRWIWHRSIPCVVMLGFKAISQRIHSKTWRHL